MVHSKMVHWYVLVPKYFVPVNVMNTISKPASIYLLK